jgi:hypothetical protein
MIRLARKKRHTITSEKMNHFLIDEFMENTPFPDLLK